MKVKINNKMKEVYIECSNIRNAGWFGFVFAKDYTGFVVDGWNLYFYEGNDYFFLNLPYCAETVDHPKELAEKIAKPVCCHNCCCIKGEK